ncbi:MAG: hypothetical protein NZ553_17520 [Caldilinea sp.]|nr:hypothetical protein [Caldilinea sp.]MDW8442281.1 hypothetical protein [Caldilineaceae bacterium]
MMRTTEAMKKFTRSVNFPIQRKYKSALAGCQKAKKRPTVKVAKSTIVAGMFAGQSVRRVLPSASQALLSAGCTHLQATSSVI